MLRPEPLRPSLVPSMQLSLEWSDFLATYWQKKPTVIRQAFPHFIDPIEPDELAGLATEEEIDSRIVSKTPSGWSVEHGPFFDFSSRTESGWTLLVQAVDHWHPEAARLLEPFRVLPNWRLDDLMISYSLPDGGVGPHIDQYDVFIIQGMGRRRWRVGERTELKQRLPHPDLLQVEEFEAIIDVELLPGDMLYIPPGFPHDGYAIEPSLNYSVGFRAPNQRDLFSALADHLLAEEQGNLRYGDPQRQACHHPGEVTASEREQLLALMQQQLQEQQYQWLGEALSRQQHTLDLQPVEPPYPPATIIESLKQGDVLCRLGGLKAIYFAEAPLHCYLAGEQREAPAKADPLIRLLCDNTRLSLWQLEPHLANASHLGWLTQLINEGYWYFDSDWSEES